MIRGINDETINRSDISNLFEYLDLYNFIIILLHIEIKMVI